MMTKEEMVLKKKIPSCYKRLRCQLANLLLAEVCFAREKRPGTSNSIVFFPCSQTLFNCGLAGIVAYKKQKTSKKIDHLEALSRTLKTIEANGFTSIANRSADYHEEYLGGDPCLTRLLSIVRKLKTESVYPDLFKNETSQKKVSGFTERLDGLIASQSVQFTNHVGHLEADSARIIFRRIEQIKDASWSLSRELIANMEKTGSLIPHAEQPPGPSCVKIFKEINAVLSSIDRLEVRGRDSAGISIVFVVKTGTYDDFIKTLTHDGRISSLEERSNHMILTDSNISISGNSVTTAMIFTYKIAAEIGSLGDNIISLRWQIKNDAILRTLTDLPLLNHTISSHTRWASVGAITEANCHPVDNAASRPRGSGQVIHACLNGDIDNYLSLKEIYQRDVDMIPEEITSDTKIIPLQIETYLNKGFPIEEAFRLALNDFEGSHAITMHCDLAPGKLFLAQRGSGQALFIGLAEDHYFATSEVYGFIEETDTYLKMNGEREIEGPQSPVQGEIFILHQDSSGGLDGIEAIAYDGTSIELQPSDIKKTQITSRDVDRQGFPHYFLKEITEAPGSVEKTLLNRWKINKKNKSRYDIFFDEKAFPQNLVKDLKSNRIKRVIFVGQGTAGVAALASSDILNHYIEDSQLQISALKASELSGFKLGRQNDSRSMADALVIAITQSGTTTDTNRTVDMVKERGARTLAIVNRRDSDITFKVDGVIYTSSGRDIEMSVASTKAFYSQIVAGALLGLQIAALKDCRDEDFITDEIKSLLDIPRSMEKVLKQKEAIEHSARRLAPTKTYWAAVGSGPNKASADEIRIKLSELCYKTISSDFVEDKKHIDLSSEPLIIVCAAGTRGTVLADIIKDTAIFNAHKAATVIIADEGEKRFNPYTRDLFFVPRVKEHLAPIINTLVGHIWGYYAALAINDGSHLLYRFREDIQKTIDTHARRGLDIYEILLEKTFVEKIVLFYRDFRSKKLRSRFPIALASDLTLLLKYLAGKLPVADFEIDFDKKGTARNMLDTLFEYLGRSINAMSRPVDAIKHQAKTVTVGTSRISEKTGGIIFDMLAEHSLSTSRLTTSNILVIRNIQEVVSEVAGRILYRIRNLNILGEPNSETTISVVSKQGVLKPIPSRVETDNRLKGTKKIIVRQGNVYIGQGRKDDRSMVVVPILSESAESPNTIDHLLLLNISFKKNIPTEVKIRALGGKYEHINNIVQENSIAWEDRYIDLVPVEELFGKSAEKVGEEIVWKLNKSTSDG
jgi:glutamine---fructose-6-phosphate transaminase (isomerizing)